MANSILTDDEILELDLLLREEDLEAGRDDFWTYLCLKSPKFYNESRPHLKQIAVTLQMFYEGRLLNENGVPYRKLILNVPPRHGKSRTLVEFCQWVLGKNNEERIIECSYNDNSAGDFSKYTRDGIQEEHQVEEGFVFHDFFPDTNIKSGSASYSKWALEGQHFNYLGAGIGGSITGKGGTITIIDDPIKLVEEAFNEERLDFIWNWYTGTFLSRGEQSEGQEPLEIICMTRWAALDPCGRILASDKAKDWYVLKMVAYDEATDKMLCDTILSKKRLKDLQDVMVPEVFWANYFQESVEVKGRLYQEFKTYNELPMDEDKNSLLEGIFNYTDTADEGSDYLCSINFGVYHGQAYVLDVLYTKDGMEITEPLTAKFLHDSNVNLAKIESNNGGRGFARAVQRILYETYKTKSIIVKWFHQSTNKIARIHTQSAAVQQNIFFPVNWNVRWPAFYKALSTYLKEGKNKHDDAPDTLTGVAEHLTKPASVRLLSSRRNNE